MSDGEQRFTRELEIFRTEAQAGAQFLYAYLSFNAVVGRNKKALRFVNRTPLLWNTSMGALQTSFFIVLGRIFDQESRHNIDALLRLAEHNPDIFSKAALAERKRRQSANADEWLPDYLRHVYEPAKADFRDLRKKVRTYRRIYDANYRDIRRKYYAHKEVTESADVQQLFSKTNVRELQKVFVFVNALYEALWHLLFNGQKPVLRPMRYSVLSMMRNRKPEWHSQSVQERIVADMQDFFKLFLGKAESIRPRRGLRRSPTVSGRPSGGP